MRARVPRPPDAVAVTLLRECVGVHQCCGRSLSGIVRQYMHKIAPAVIDKMAPDATKHEIEPRLRKPHDLHPVLPKRSTEVEWLQTESQSPVNAVRRIINQC